ncbi:MAG TPA: T9SS type A sorting domain-containing protein, partial [Bacteroidia bacterium]|nr:T9SS type A sorting domain-containing protein [Bacteroidia bacterium]
ASPEAVAAFPVNISIHPNPAQDFVTLRLQSNALQTLEINVLEVATGKSVLKSQRLKLRAQKLEELRLDLTNLPAGHYQILIGNGSQTHAIPLVHFR